MTDAYEEGFADTTSGPPVFLTLSAPPVYPAFLQVHVPELGMRSAVLMTLPDSKLTAGKFSLHKYPPLEQLKTLTTVYGVYHQGTRPKKAKTKQEVEDTHPLAYVFGSALPSQETPTSVLFRSRKRVLDLDLDTLDSKVLSSQGVDAQLMFRGPHFTIHHATNTFTLISTTILPDRLLNVLTSV